MNLNKQTLKLSIVLIISIGLSFFSVGCKQQNVVLNQVEGKLIPVEETLEKDAAIEQFIKPYREKLDQEMGLVLAYNPQSMSRERDAQETLIGNFLADLCFTRGQFVFEKREGKAIDFVLLNIGGIRASLDIGDVTVKNAYEIMPFENTLMVAELSYNEVIELVQYLANSGTPHPISKELKVVFNGNNVVSALLNGQEFNKNKTYYVLTSDYLLHGGDHMDFFKKALNTYDLDYKVRAALLDELTAIDTIRTKLDGRMIRN